MIQAGVMVRESLELGQNGRQQPPFNLGRAAVRVRVVARACGVGMGRGLEFRS